jgi:cytidyltransferase-like protein
MFDHVVCGGTFDRFHDGHHALLEKCFEIGKHTTIGIASQKMALEKLKTQFPQPWSIRRRSVANFAKQHHANVTIVSIDDIYGPTILERSINAIVVSKETLSGAQLINKKRIQIGMKPLSIIIIDLKRGSDTHIISSTRVRNGVINRHGQAYFTSLISKQKYILPKSLIPTLRIPLGRSFRSVSECVEEIQSKNRPTGTYYPSVMWITVGDVTTYEFKKLGFSPTLSIIDKKTQRKALKDTYIQKIIEKDCQNAPNQKGTISQEAIIKLKELLYLEHNGATKQLIIDGEEDLLVLPAVLLSPLQTRILYGMRGKGIVCVEVTEKAKKKVYNLIQKFH